MLEQTENKHISLMQNAKFSSLFIISSQHDNQLNFLLIPFISQIAT